MPPLSSSTCQRHRTYTHSHAAMMSATCLPMLAIAFACFSPCQMTILHVCYIFMPFLAACLYMAYILTIFSRHFHFFAIILRHCNVSCRHRFDALSYFLAAAMPMAGLMPLFFTDIFAAAWRCLPCRAATPCCFSVFMLLYMLSVYSVVFMAQARFRHCRRHAIFRHYFLLQQSHAAMPPP